MSTKTRKSAKVQGSGDGAIAAVPQSQTKSDARAYAKALRSKEREAEARRARNQRYALLLALSGVATLALVVVLLFLLGVFRESKMVSIPSEGAIFFLRTESDGKRNLYMVNPDGTGQTQVTRDLLIEGSWAWSGKSRYILAQVSEGGQSEIARITLGSDNKASETVSLTADVNADAAFPAWSPDGSKIAFQHKGEGGFQVFVMDADGKNKRKVSGGTGYAGLPAWSPDSKQVIFIAGDKPDIGSPKELYVADVEGAGGAPRKLTAFQKDITRPTWSPDGKLIAYIERVTDRNGSMMVVGPDGQNPRKLADSASNSTPQFSPQSDRVVYYNVAPPDGSDIYVVAVAGGEPTRITAASSDDYVPTWSPDGTRLTWASIIASGGQGHKIVVANPDGSERKAVSSGEGDDYQPLWIAAQEQGDGANSR